MTAIELVRMREKVALDPKHDDKDREIVSEILKLIYGNSQDDYSLYKTMQADILLGREFESDPDYSFTYSHTEDTEIIRLCEDAHNYAVDHADDLSSTVMQLEEEVNRVIPIEKEYREILNHHPSDEAIPMLLEWAGKYGFSLPKDAHPIKTVFDGCFYDTPEKDKRNPYSIFCKWFSENIDLEELHRNECRLAYCKALLKRGIEKQTEEKAPSDNIPQIEKQAEEQESQTVTSMPTLIKDAFKEFSKDIRFSEWKGKEVAFYNGSGKLKSSSIKRSKILGVKILLEYLINPSTNKPFDKKTLYSIPVKT